MKKSSQNGLRPARWLIFLLCSAEASAVAQVTFSSSFDPGTIGPGSVSTLTWVIDNPTLTPVSDLAFTNGLPAGLTIASPAQARTTCINARLDASDGESTVSLVGGRLGTSSRCTVTVDVTSLAPAAYTNVSGDLTHSGGHSGPSTALLTVDASRPGFTKRFLPATIGRDGISTMTFTIADPGTSGFFNFSVVDRLPLGMVVADPPRAVTDCENPTFSPTPGANTISLSAFNLTAGLTCTASVDVTASAAGYFASTSEVLSSSRGGGGKAGAVLMVELKSLVKTFIDDPAAPGATVTVEYTLTNFERESPATQIAFIDDLDAALPGLAAVGLPRFDACGPGSQLMGTSLLALVGGQLAPQASCTFAVELAVPAFAAPGAYPSATSRVTVSLDGQSRAWDEGIDALSIENAPRLSQTFPSSPTAAGDTLTLEFGIVNPSPSIAMTDLAFSQDFGDAIPQLQVSSAPTSGFCGAGASMGIVPPSPNGNLSLFVENASLPAGGDCTFSIDLEVPLDTPGGTYAFSTSRISGTSDGRPSFGPSAEAEVSIVGAPSWSKAFNENPVAGGLVSLVYTLTYNENAPAEATDLTFTDDLEAVLAGLVATNLPLDDVCGPGSTLSGTSQVVLSQGALSPGATCTFQVDLDVPDNVFPGAYPSVTGDLTGTSAGLNVTSPPASAVLRVAGLDVSAVFARNPRVPGQSVSLGFTVRNATSTTADSMTMSADLNGVLSGLLVLDALPRADACGSGSSLSSSGNTLILSGGNLPSGDACSFDVSLQIPANALPGDYALTTGPLFASLNGTPVTVPGSFGVLRLVPAVTWAKAFTNDPVLPGDAARLEFTITNHGAEPLTQLSFSDDVAAQVPMTALGLPQDDVCGPGSQLAGSDVITLTGGTVTASTACTFGVDVAVPADLSIGAQITNTTGPLSGQANGHAVAGEPARDALTVDHFTFAQALTSSPTPGSMTRLVFTIERAGTSSEAAPLRFFEELEPALAGLSAAGLPRDDVCGPGSRLVGTDTIQLVSGSIQETGRCTFEVDLIVPPSAVPGPYALSTSDLSAFGMAVAGPATAILNVVSPPPDAGVLDAGLRDEDAGQERGDAAQGAPDARQADDDAGSAQPDADQGTPDAGPADDDAGGDGTDDAGTGTRDAGGNGGQDAGVADTGPRRGPGRALDDGCGCATTRPASSPSGAALLWALALLPLWLRRLTNQTTVHVSKR